MIKLPKYSSEFEKKYKEIVESILGTLDDDTIIQNHIFKLFPKAYRQKKLSELMMLEFSELQVIINYVNDESDTEKKDILDEIKKKEGEYERYKDLVKKYNKLRDYILKTNDQLEIKMSIKLVEELGITVCPYCNRDFINCRSESKSGAELDHFFNKSAYPFFALALYNLVPCCHNCNHVKSASDIALSPFDEIFDYKKKVFDFKFIELDKFKVIEDASITDQLKRNMIVFGLDKAYSIHSADVKRIITKAVIYNSTRRQEIIDLMNESLLSANGNAKESKYEIDNAKIDEYLFDQYDDETHFGTVPLSKLSKDIMDKYKEDNKTTYTN